MGLRMFRGARVVARILGGALQPVHLLGRSARSPARASKFL